MNNTEKNRGKGLIHSLNRNVAILNVVNENNLASKTNLQQKEMLSKVNSAGIVAANGATWSKEFNSNFRLR